MGEDAGFSTRSNDNGSLMEMLLAGTRPGPPNNKAGSGRMSPMISSPERGCIDILQYERYGDYITCHWQHFYQHRTQNVTSPWWDIDLYDWAEKGTPFSARIYKMYGGFVRESPVSNSPHGVGLDGYWPGDFLYHGQKTDELFDRNMVMCTGKDWKYGPE